MERGANKLTLACDLMDTPDAVYQTSPSFQSHIKENQ